MNLLLLDKDGTLVIPSSGAKFVKSPWDQSPHKKASSILDSYKEKGWDIAIISNQAGVAAGHKLLHDCFLEFRFCLELFPVIDSAYFCPDFEGAICWRIWGDCSGKNRIEYNPENTLIEFNFEAYKFRKPNPGMLLAAIQHFDPDGEILFVGDRDEDKGAATAAGIAFQWAEDFFA
ncbi:MAG: HAD-IA family hydrolase [Microcoleaceae cyanobacterium]